MNTTTTNTGAASLLPCPFCGGEAKSFEESLDERFAYANKITIRCSGCDVSVGATGIIPHGGYADNSTTEKRAVEAWNRRPTPQADAAPIGMHVAALLAARDWLTDSNSPLALRNQIDAAIAAGGAQEAVADAKSKLPEFSGCIEWSNYRNRQGYGSFKADGKMSLAHRVMYCDYHGVTRDSIKHLVVRHACDNPSCFNPAHLLLGTHADNTKDKIERGRHARGEMNGQSKLSRHQAGQIRSLYVRGSREFGIPALAKKFGVGQSTIREVVLNLRWVETTPSNGEQA